MSTTSIVRRTLAAVGLGALLAAGVTVAAPSAKADVSDTDIAFLATLKSQGIEYSSNTFAINVGHAICVDLANGYSASVEATRLWALSGLNLYNAGYYVGAAIGAYCPGASSTNAGTVRA